MFMQKATPEIVERWKEVLDEYKDKLRSNLKYGKEVVEYLKNKYFLVHGNDGIDNLQQMPFDGNI